jgi:hypothetical protein
LRELQSGTFDERFGTRYSPGKLDFLANTHPLDPFPNPALIPNPAALNPRVSGLVHQSHGNRSRSLTLGVGTVDGDCPQIMPPLSGCLAQRCHSQAASVVSYSLETTWIGVANQRECVADLVKGRGPVPAPR